MTNKQKSLVKIITLQTAKFSKFFLLTLVILATLSCGGEDDPAPEKPIVEEKPTTNYIIKSFTHPDLGSFEYYTDDHGTVIPTNLKLDKFIQNEQFKTKLLAFINQNFPFSKGLNR